MTWYNIFCNKYASYILKYYMDVWWEKSIFLVRWLLQWTLVPSFFYLSFFLSNNFHLLYFMFQAWASICASVHWRVWVCTVVCMGVLGCVQVCKGVCAGVRQCVRVCAGVHGYTLVCPCVHGYARVCASMCRSVRKCAEVCRSARVSASVCVGWIFRIPTGDYSPYISGL